VERFDAFDLVVYAGSLERAKLHPRSFSPEDAPHLERFFDRGGTLVICRPNRAMLVSPALRAWVGDVLAAAQASDAPPAGQIVRRPAGEGEIAYVDFVAKHLEPQGRKETTAADEHRFNEAIQAIFDTIDSICDL
jgi:hypothetical protein